jgi:hypothetical protein
MIRSWSNCSRAPSRESATRRCSIRISCALQRRNTAWLTPCCARKASRSTGAPGNMRIICSALRRSCERKWRRKASRSFTRPSICPSRRCSPRWSATACASTAKRSTPCPRRWSTKSARSKKQSGNAGSEFNVNSPLQLAEILFDKMGSDAGGRRRGKPRSTAADVLEELALLHELPRKVLEYREISKLKSTYVDALPKLIHAETGRLHTSFSQTGAATGRLSSSDPNLQNIPVRSELGRQIRAAFVASPGQHAAFRRLFADRAAHPGAFLKGSRAGRGVPHRAGHPRAHRQEVFGVGPMAQNAEHRRAAKAINFGIIYGQTPLASRPS